MVDFLKQFGFEYHARPNDARYSGTFAEPKPATTINKYDAKGNLKEDNAVQKPLPQRTIENMTVYFKKVSDCDYKPLEAQGNTPTNRNSSF